MAGHVYEGFPDESNFPQYQKGILIHHKTDDEMVLFKGCCASGTPENQLGEKKCCCGISTQSDVCMSMDGVFEQWKAINGCGREHKIVDFSIEAKLHIGQDCDRPTIMALWTDQDNLAGHHARWARSFDG